MTRKNTADTPDATLAVRPLARQELAKLFGGKLERSDSYFPGTAAGADFCSCSIGATPESCCGEP